MTIQFLLPGMGEGKQGHSLKRDVVLGITSSSWEGMGKGAGLCCWQGPGICGEDMGDIRMPKLLSPHCCARFSWPTTFPPAM